MENIYSRVQPDKLLHIIFKENVLTSLSPHKKREWRKDIIPATEGLQVACLKLSNGQTFRPHFHVERPRTIPRTQEGWIVMRGIVEVIYYDIDKAILKKATLLPGDGTFTLEGGHNYKTHTSGTIVFEIKTGPWIGTEVDKEFIEEAKASA